MVTQHLHRVLVITAASRIAALNTWVHNNLDPTGGDWLVAGLSPTGVAPATHGWCCAGLTNAQGKLVLDRWYAVAGMTPPAWATMTRAQIRSRLVTDRAALTSASQIVMWHCDNDGDWDDFPTILSNLGLVVIT